MSEQQIREALRGAVATEPSPDFDPDAIIDTARRRTRRRTMTAASAGVAAVALAAAAVSGALEAGPDRSVPIAATGGTSVADRGLEQRAAEIEEYLAKRLPEVLEGIRVVSVGPFGNTGDGKISPDGPRMLRGTVVLEDDHGRIGLWFGIRPPHGPGADEPMPGPPPSSDDFGGPDMVVLTPHTAILTRDMVLSVAVPGDRERMDMRSVVEALQALAGDPNLSLRAG